MPRPSDVPEAPMDLAAAGVRPEHRLAVARLVREWRWPGAPRDPAARRRDALADYGHYLLFERSREGDAGAARRFEAYWRKAARAFLGRGFTAEQAEEFHALFLARVYQHAPTFAFATPFTAYLRTILLNIARDEVRRLRSRRAREVSLDDDGAGARRSREAADPAPSAEATLIAGERRDAVARALARLAPADRDVLVACVVEGRSGEAAAAALGIRRDALYQRLKRARGRLQALVLEELSDR